MSMIHEVSLFQCICSFPPQKSCIQFVINAKPMDVYVPEDDKGLSYHVWRLVTSPPFENFIMLLIMLNT